jgi:hypothetical protein
MTCPCGKRAVRTIYGWACPQCGAALVDVKIGKAPVQLQYREVRLRRKVA